MDSCKSLLPDARSFIAEIFDAERKQNKLKGTWRGFWF